MAPNFKAFLPSIPVIAGIPWLFLSSISAAERPISFAKEIRPILSNACFKCHGPDENERKGGPKGSGGLRLDTEAGARMSLGETSAIIAGHPEQSHLMARVTTTDAGDIMPPPKSGKTLTVEEIQLLSTWIQQGAKYSKHWSYEPPLRQELPIAGLHPVDSFIRDRLANEGLQPQPEADRATLARRLSLDLTGLPPRPDEVDAFVSDAAPDAYDRLADRLLASPAYGEHQARGWLDLARYADSAGYADDPPRPIWGFRDYVIKSFNANKPFDQFTIEQIAGDLLPDASEDQLMATAFHRNTMTNSEGGTNDEEFRNAAIVDRVNTTMAVWMGTSMACAQCHTHKYDPITQTEYFQMFAYLNNTADADLRDEAPLLDFLTESQKEERRKLEADVAATDAKFKNPTTSQQTAADQWASAYPLDISWQPLTGASLKSEAGLPMTQEADGTIAVPTAASRDTYTIDFQVPAVLTSLAGLRLEALPDPSLPGGGPGHGGGNFVITGLTAKVQPPLNAPVPRARFVRVELPGRGKLLQLAEVQVFSDGKNIAPTGTASQKSTFAGAAASRAIDGNTAAEYEKGSVSHTADQTGDPWWEVELKDSYPIHKISVWNRAEAAERLEGFRITVLDAQRQPIWEKAGNAAAPQIDFTLNGERGIVFSNAAASYEQPGFVADSLITSPANIRKERKQNQARDTPKGWAIGGAPGKAHTLTLAAAAPVEIPAGSSLRITIAQQSTFPSHTLGRFSLGLTANPVILQQVDLPASEAALLAKPASSRNAEERAALTAFYLREIAPDMVESRQQLAALRKQIDANQPSTLPIYRELPAGKRRTTHLQVRGNYLNHGDVVTEGVPATIFPLPDGPPGNRLTLARWLIHPDNPLTARVVANRYWESLFGTGIVRTSEEFGSQGEMPSHPELLDWLATELIREKWDIKKFIRLLITSATYRQSSRVEPGAAARDPDNRLLARGPRLRLSAEMIRDQALAVSGLLSPKMFGPSVRPVRPALGLSAAFGGGLDWQTSTGGDQHRRGLYTEWRRTSPYPSMSTFDAPNRETCTLQRGRSNTPLQALVLMNDPVFIEASQALARRVTSHSENPAAILRECFRLVLSRAPAEKELQRLVKLQAELLAAYRKEPEKAAAMATNPIGPIPAGADPANLAAWTATVGVLLNLDETLMKR